MLFEKVLHEVLPQMALRWHSHTRPLPPALRWAHEHFTAVLALDGSTLDTLLRKCGLLRDGHGPLLARRMAAVLDYQVFYNHRFVFVQAARIAVAP